MSFSDSSRVNPNFMAMSPHSHATAAAQPVSQDLAPSFASLQGVFPSTPSPEHPNPTGNQKKRRASPATPERRSKRSSTAEQSPAAHSTPGFRPNEFDFALADENLVDAENANAASTAITDFLDSMDKLIAVPPEKRRTPRQNLQAFLIQQQLLAGISVDKLESMSGPGANQSSFNKGGAKRFNTPAVMTVTRNATYIPHVRPAQFIGSVTPLPIHESLPKPSWMNNANGNGHHTGVNSSDSMIHTHNSVTSTESQKVNNFQTPDDITGTSAYFSSAAEQAALTQFYSQHFSTGSGLLQQPAASPADASLANASPADIEEDRFSFLSDNNSFSWE